jgi:hypothetical protein
MRLFIPLHGKRRNSDSDYFERFAASEFVRIAVQG